MPKFALAIVLGWSVTLVAPARSADLPQKITYNDHVRPILREHCFTCHNQGKATNDLALDSYDRIRKGGASGEAIMPGDPDNSYLFALVSHKDQPHMPPNADKLPPAKLEIIRQWIVGGALKNSGATAEVKKPTVNLTMTAGATRPEGPPVMPEGVPHDPVAHTQRPGAVTALATSPWAPLAAIAGQKQICLYNTDTAQLVGVLPFPEGIPYVLRFSRSGRLLLAGGGKSSSHGLVAGYDVRTGKRLFQLGDELDAVLAADINASQTLVALGGPQKIVRVYSIADGSLVTEVKKHTDWITAVEFSPDGVLLATADRAGGVWVWEAGTDREFHNLEGHKGPVTGMSWRDDSNVLATTSEDGNVKLWGMEDGKRLKSITAHNGGAASVQFLHDGRFVTGGRDRVVKFWAPAGTTIRATDAFPDLVLKVAATHDGGRLLGGDWSGEVRLFAAADGKPVGTLASNPPTIEMVLQAAQAKAAATKAEADKVLEVKQKSAVDNAKKQPAAKK